MLSSPWRSAGHARETTSERRERLLFGLLGDIEGYILDFFGGESVAVARHGTHTVFECIGDFLSGWGKGVEVGANLCDALGVLECVARCAVLLYKETFSIGEALLGGLFFLLCQGGLWILFFLVCEDMVSPAVVAIATFIFDTKFRLAFSLCVGGSAEDLGIGRLGREDDAKCAPRVGSKVGTIELGGFPRDAIKAIGYLLNASFSGEGHTVE